MELKRIKAALAGLAWAAVAACLSACPGTGSGQSAGAASGPGTPRSGRSPGRSPTRAKDPTPPRPAPPAPARMPRGYRVAYNFMDNAASADFYLNGGLVIRCDEPGFAKYVDGTWQNPWILGKTVWGKKLALVQRREGKLMLPIDPLRRTGRGPHIRYNLYVSVHNRLRDQRIKVRVNKKRAAKAAVRRPHQVLHLRLPARLFRKTGNFISLRFDQADFRADIKPLLPQTSGRYRIKYGRRVEWAAGLESIAFGPPGFKNPMKQGRLPRIFRMVTVGGRTRKALALPSPGHIRYRVVPPAGALLTFKHARLPGTSTPARFVIRAQVDGKPPRAIYRSHGSNGWLQGAVSLASFAGRAVRLDFVVEKGPGAWTDVAMHARPSPVNTWTKKPVRYVFFWLADTLRRDCLGTYGSKIVRTPQFDKFAKRAVVFDQATIQGNHSIPGHASILTGAYPPVHGFDTKHDRVSKATPLLYWMFKHSGGWLTGLFSSNGYVSMKWGFKRGLYIYRNFIRASQRTEAEYLWKAARRYVRKKLRHKIFLYLATIDPHVAYDPPEKFLRWYYPGKYRGPVPRRVTGYFLRKIVMKRVKLKRPKDRKRFMALYYGEISYNDHWFGAMIRDLRRMGILDQSAIVITTDHGEQFFEHGSVGHGSTLYESEIAAPLIIRWPGLPNRQIRIPWDVEVMDIYSTLMDLAGIKQKPATQSRSLLPLVRGGRAEAMHSAFSFNYEGTRSVKVGRYKLVMYRPGRYRFYDLKTDPTEQRKIQNTHPIAFRMCKNIFSLKNAHILRWRKTRWGEASNLAPQFNSDFGL